MKTAAEKAVTLAGGPAVVAHALGLHRSTPSQWVARGRVPAAFVIDVEQLCGAQVTRHEMRPDVFGERAA